ncbi:hydantoinase protein [Colletotrichum incanum]|nr:hydantoinase protein [Colletotrichum incanum]
MISPILKIGVDVGGTNTDGVILDPTASSSPKRGILASHKTSTTANPSDGINTVISRMFQDSSVDPARVASVTIGTTHFINAVVEMDASRLARVAVLRLCGPFSASIPIGVDWPPHLRETICAHRGLVDGGLEIDGSLISELDEDGVRREAEVIKAKDIRSIVVVGIFSPIDVVYRQEERAAKIIQDIYPSADVVMSKDVANIGFLERKNAAILNASILPFARRTIHSFQDAVFRLGLKCPVFVTQNDGTILPASAAAKLPIRTFSSGPTNSMRGAAFLTRHLEKEVMMVVDIGGTTTDVGLLLENGFPRQAAAHSEISGVRTNFSYPDVKSIGLGGGSIVRREKDGGLIIGPQSVGYQIRQKALVFGGNVATTTDYTVLADPKVNIGDRSFVEIPSLREALPEFKAKVKRMLERIIDTMKTSPDDIPVVLVGGGAVIAPDALVGASRVIKPEWSGVANAIGAATARVSGVIDSIESTETKSSAEVIKELSQRAVDRAVENGALRDSVTIAEIESFPLQYIANKTRMIIKAVGDFDFSRAGSTDATPMLDGVEGYADESSLADERQTKISNNDIESPSQAITYSKEYIDTYKPKVIDRQWHLSETDLDWITIGCYILGTGGGGSPYQHMLRLREMMRAGATVRVISPFDLTDDDIVACGGGKGSPQVSIEKPYGDEIMESQRELYEYLGTKPTAVISLEIGGGNGLQGLILGASTNLDIMTKARTELDAERAFRAALSQMGSHVGCAKGPVSGRDTKSWVVENTLSLSWRIGRAVALSRCTNTIDSVAEAIVNEVGGKDSARVLFRGKIVGVERVTRMGHAYGEVIIENSASYDSANGCEKTTERLKIPFKNENIFAKKIHGDGEEEILAIVPDLVCVVDAQNGEAIGTQEYRYGLLVVVLGIAASEKWTSTARGIEIGGPKGFGMDGLEYVPLGKFKKPRSVIEEFGV